jgi:hypothetical protein
MSLPLLSHQRLSPPRSATPRPPLAAFKPTPGLSTPRGAAPAASPGLARPRPRHDAETRASLACGKHVAARGRTWQHVAARPDPAYIGLRRAHPGAHKLRFVRKSNI